MKVKYHGIKTQKIIYIYSGDLNTSLQQPSGVTPLLKNKKIRKTSKYNKLYNSKLFLPFNYLCPISLDQIIENLLYLDLIMNEKSS